MTAENPTLTITERLAHWSNATDLDHMPAAVIEVAKRCIIDLCGVSLAATPHALTRKVFCYAQHNYAPGCAEVLGFPESLSPPGAALVNGTAGHVLDFDDTSYTGIMHGSTVAFPAALAATQSAGASGRRLLEAFIVGSEVTYAVALLGTTSHYFKGWWSTATFGVFGAAAAAAKGLGLGPKRTVSAIALAGVQANGQKAAFGTDAKPYLAGRIASTGVESALLAAYGLGGPPMVLEDSRGFLALLNDGISDLKSIEHLGSTWRLTDPGIFFKQFPVCSAAHAAIETTVNLLAAHSIIGSDVEHVLCEVPAVVDISLVYNRPASVQQAQFSMPFAIGAVLVHGELAIFSLTDAALSDPRMKDAMSRVEMRRVDSIASPTAPEGARVTIRTRDGRIVSDYLGEPTGMPRNPMSAAKLRDKFLRCAEAGGVAEPVAHDLYDRLDNLETLRSVSNLFDTANAPTVARAFPPGM